MYRSDTIVACATPPGRGAVAIVRISGPQSFDVLSALLGGDPGALTERRLSLRTVRDPRDGTPIDDALVVKIASPDTYTGEDLCEIQCHGSPVVVERIVSAACAAGARSAERGEFTRRAVMNGRMDLLQAEAVADLIDSRLDAGAAAAWRQLQGALSKRLGAMRARILDVLADVEANVDFSDEELPAENIPARVSAIEGVRSDIEALGATFALGKREREGLRLVFLGPPNAGKSSLVNRLLGSDRMIVSDEAGTTRDTVEEIVEIGGRAFVLTDTAGLRTTESSAETQAIERSRNAAAAADVVVLVLDGSKDFAAEERSALAELEGLSAASGAACIRVLNKSDLPSPISGPSTADFLRTSATVGEGCAELERAIADAGSDAWTRHHAGGDAQPLSISRTRHLTALELAHGHLGAAAAALGAQGDPELIAVDLREALAALAGVTEPLGDEEVLDRVFSAFCIGK